MTWVVPSALYLGGRLYQGLALHLRQGHLVELTDTPPPEARPIPGLLSPSWINAHTHLELTHLQRQLAPSLGLRAFIYAMGPKRGEAPPELIKSALKAAYDEGTTGFVSHQNSPLPPDSIPPGVQVWPLAEFFGLRPHKSPWLKARMLGYPLTPHSLYALSRNLWRKARRPTPFPKSLHFLESVEERLWLTKGSGVFRHFLTTFHHRPYKPKLWPALQLLSRRAPALWLVHATEAPLSLLEKILTCLPNAYLVLCPLANAYLTRRCPPLSFLTKYPDRILLGTDSLANSPSLSLWPVVRYLLQSGWSWEKVLLAAAETPRRWLALAPTWTIVSPLGPDLSLLPFTQAYRLTLPEDES